MKTIAENVTTSFRELGSKFLGYLFKCNSEIEFKRHLENIKKEFPDASHHCYGYRIDPVSVIEFSSDDGEPSGAAGLPILNQLKSFELINCGIVVVRYFGGTKLGKTGLIQAYGDTAKLCLKKAVLKNIQLVRLFKITYAYSLESRINKLIINYELKEQNAEYLETVSKIFACPTNMFPLLEKELISLSHLSITFKMLHKSYISDAN